MWSKISTFFSMFGGSCGIGALFLYFYLVPIKDMVPGKEAGHIYERLYFQMWILEMVLLTIGVAAAVLGFIGYQSIKEEAVKRAVEEAKKEFNVRFGSTVRPQDADEEFGRVSPSQVHLETSEEERQ